MSAAQAAITTSTFSGDATFQAACPSNACESAVGEARAGDRGGSGTWETGIWVPNNNVGTNLKDQKSFALPQTPVSFSFSYNGSSLSLTVDGTTSTTSAANLSGVTSLLVRVRGVDSNNFASLTNLSFNGTSLGSLTATSPTAEYLQILGFAATGPWSLTGTMQLQGGSNSTVAANFKLTNLSEVPLPAAAWLFGTAVLGLGAAMRRRRAAA